MRRLLIALAAFGPLATAPGQCPLPGPRARLVATKFEAGRLLAAPVSQDGDTTFLFLDTGGGGNLLSDAVAARLGLPVRTEPNGARTAPAPGTGTWRDLPLARSGPPAPGRFHVVSAERSPMQPLFVTALGGLLAGGWFADRVWTMDYPHHQLWLRDAPPRETGREWIPIYLRTDAQGRHPTNLPRLRVVVDGDTLDMLLDTGASTRLTDSALSVIGDGGPAGRATSFVTAEWFDRWHARHPDWPTVEHADIVSGFGMIRVPTVRVGGTDVGPVWFTMRATRDFHADMDPMMDRPIDGALGGSALQYLVVTLDYPNARACFEKAR